MTDYYKGKPIEVRGDITPGVLYFQNENFMHFRSMPTMNSEEILSKAIEKAQTNGWEMVYPYDQPVHRGIGVASNRLFFGDCAEVTMLLFNHDFAKALWGENEGHDLLSQDMLIIPESCDGDCLSQAHFSGPVWQYYLQQMVVADNPIAYLGENLD